MTRQYTQVKILEERILEMREAGKTRQEIADELGLSKVQIKNWVSRYNKAQTRLKAGVPPRRRGRPRQSEPTSEEEYQYEIKRLKMENELLRDFLQLAGRW
jgi:transposase